MEKRERPSNEKNPWRKETEEKVMHAGHFITLLEQKGLTAPGTVYIREQKSPEKRAKRFHIY